MKKQNHFTPLRQNLYETFSICRYVIPASLTTHVKVPKFFETPLKANRSAYIIQGISKAIRKNPEVNSSFIRNKWTNKSRIVRFDNVNCAVSFEKKLATGENYPFTYIFKNADQMSVEEIDKISEYINKTPAEEIPEFQRFLKFVQLPRFVRRIFLRRLISNEELFQNTIGTFNLSNLSMLEGSMGGSMTTPRLVIECATKKQTQELQLGYNFNHVLIDGREITKLNRDIIKIFRNFQFD